MDYSYTKDGKEGNLQRNADGRNIESTLSGNTKPGGTGNGRSDETDGGKRGSERRAESVQSDEVGSNDEQYQTFSGGNRIDGVSLQPLIREEQQNIKMKKPDNARSSGKTSLSGSFLYNVQSVHDSMEIQKGILCFDDFLIHKRPEIAGYFAMEQDTKLQTEYLKNSFRMEEYTEFNIGENEQIRVGYRADEDGFTMWKGSSLTQEVETRMSWEDARYWINSYIEDGVYLLPGEKVEQIDTNGIYRQLDLFSLFTEQVGSIAMKQAEQGSVPKEKEIQPPKEVIQKEQLDIILRSGGGRENSRKRIYAQYQQDKTSEEMVEFLKKEYGTTGKGFELNGKQISVWFDNHGMTASYGTSALEHPKFTMDWTEIEQQIRSQVESGVYMSAKEVYLDEYGTGGQSPALAGADHSWEDHDFKGIKLEKGSILEPYAKVLLPWKAVEERIRKLIQKDKYLSPEGKVAFVAYKEEKAQAKMERDRKVSCKDAIERAIAENFDGYRLPKETAESVIKEYGTERVAFVLATTIMHRRKEEKLSSENKEWAKKIEPYAMIENRDMVVDSHPAVLNGFINQARKYIEREKELAKEVGENYVIKLNVMEKRKLLDMMSRSPNQSQTIRLVIL